MTPPYVCSKHLAYVYPHVKHNSSHCTRRGRDYYYLRCIDGGTEAQRDGATCGKSHPLREPAKLVPESTPNQLCSPASRMNDSDSFDLLMTIVRQLYRCPSIFPPTQNTLGSVLHPLVCPAPSQQNSLREEPTATLPSVGVAMRSHAQIPQESRVALLP